MKNRNIKNKILSFIDSHIISYGTPSSINYTWSFGALAGVMLIVQIVSGLLIGMHYSSDVDSAFKSVQMFTRNGNYGWFVRFLHANGASFFFATVYAHIFKAMYYGSYFYPRHVIWYVGLVMFLLMMATAFIGYVLPWGQMSLWGATVITNLFTSIPFVGDSITKWLWGGYSVGGPTLMRFAALHYFIPWILVGLVLLHLALVHAVASNNPAGSEKGQISKFFPYFGLKDLHACLVLFLVLSFVITYIPNYLGHPDNYIPANPFVTPKHIVPEWYFLPFYAILRSIPHKAAGVAAMAGSILILFLIPHLNTSLIRNTFFRPVFSIFLALFVIDFVMLGWVGQLPVESPYEFLGLYLTFYYYAFFVIILPVSGLIERRIIENEYKSLKHLFESEKVLMYRQLLKKF